MTLSIPKDHKFIQPATIQLNFKIDFMNRGISQAYQPCNCSINFKDNFKNR